MLVADRITDMFTDVHSMKWPESRSLCMACSALQSQKPFRLYSSLITEEGVRHVARATWAEVLTRPPDPPWAACLAVSGQKHLFFRTQVNYQNQLVYVQMEETGIRFDPAELSELLAVVERLYTAFTKDEILSGDYSSGLIRLYGLSDFEQDEWHASRYRGERLLNLAVWIARRDAEAREARLAAAKERKEQRTEGVGRDARPKAARKPAEPRPATEPATEAVGQMSLF